MAANVSDDWRRRLKARFCPYWPLKTAGIVLVVSAFMGVYFMLLNHPQYPVRVMPLMAPDRWIAFVPWAVVPYVSLWVYIGLVPSLLHGRREMRRYLGAAGALALIGCAAFYFWPTAVPAFPVDWSRWPMVEVLKTTDATGNACPSLHVGFAVLTVWWLERLLRVEGAPSWLRGLNGAWCVLIVWSTMATRQHVAWDVVAGGALGATLAAISLAGRPVIMRHAHNG